MFNEFDSETWLYIVLIGVFAVFFFWNRSRAKQHRNSKKNFKKSYYEKKKNDS